MRCDQVQERLSEYLENRLDAENHTSVHDHLSSCPHCQAEAHGLAQTLQAVADLPIVGPPPSFSQRVMAKIREESHKPSLLERLFFPLPIKIPIHAMAILLVGGLAVYLYQANKPAQIEIARSMPSESEPVPQKDLQPTFKPASPAASLEQRSKESNPVTPGKRGVLKQNEIKSTQQSGTVSPKKEAEVKSLGKGIVVVPMAPPPPPVQMVDYELTFTPKEPLEGMKVLAPKIEALVKKVGGEYLPPIERGDTLNRDLLLRPQTIWLTFPEDRYGQFKTELAALGMVQEIAIAPEMPAGTMAAPKPPTEGLPLLRIKLTLQLPEKPK